MSQKHFLLIINPISGTHNKKGIERLVQTKFSNLNWTIDVAYTTKKGDATQYALNATAKNISGVIIVGGDGSINETASALCNTCIPLGIIPMGSGNGLARHLHIPTEPNKAIDIILQNNIIDCDYGTINSLPFFCTCGIGFDANVSKKFAEQNRRGRLMYFKSAFSEYIKYKPETYTIQIGEYTLTDNAFLVAICNASQYGNNAFIAPKASINDGLLDITIVHSGSILKLASVGLDLFSGSINSNSMVSSFKVKEATIFRSNRGPVHIDGEPISLDSILNIKCHTNALKIFSPKQSL